MTDAPYISPLDQARILSEALPHMQEYDEETIVIKRGGHHYGYGARAEMHRDHGWHRGWRHHHRDRVVVIKKHRY